MTAALAPRRSGGELMLRILSAIVLIPFGLFVVHQGGLWLAVGCAVFACVMGFEWARMSRQGPIWLAAGALALINLAFYFVNAALVVYALGGFALLFGLMHWRQAPLAAFGMVYAGGLPFALQVLREGGPWDGQAAALMLMGIVWASDSGAYFAGRSFGGPSLSSDSPNKTWSGAAGGVLCAALSGLIGAGLLNTPPWGWVLFGAAISVTAQLGDLAESQIKRRFGVKDASGFVPGHGGVMDRVDGLGAVCVLAVAVFLAWPGLVQQLGY